MGWVGFGGLAVLAWTLISHLVSGADNPPGLIALLTPANLFTGVLACGLICLLAAWADNRFLPVALQMNRSLSALNALAGVAFVALGMKGYWDHSGAKALVILTTTLALGWTGALVGKRFWA